MGQVSLGWKAILLENRRFTQFLFLSLLPVLSLAPEETSVAEGMTRPSRGQCDAGHVIPPAVLVSISSVPLHSVDRELGPIRFPQPCRQPGKANPLSAQALPPAHPPVGPWFTFICPFRRRVPWPGGRWNCAPQPLPLGGGLPLRPAHLFCLPCHRCLTSARTPTWPACDLMPPGPLGRSGGSWRAHPQSPVSCPLLMPSSPFQVRRGLSATLLPPSLAPTVSALNHEAASTLPLREAPCKCLPGPNPSTPGCAGVGGWDYGLGLSDHLGRGAWRRDFLPSSPSHLIRLWPCTRLPL